MSFLNKIGLGFMDPTNELDKFANAIKGRRRIGDRRTG